jgi:hypothetical protein
MLTECALDDFRITGSRHDGIAAIEGRASDFEAEATGCSGNEPNKCFHNDLIETMSDFVTSTLLVYFLFRQSRMA